MNPSMKRTMCRGLGAVGVALASRLLLACSAESSTGVPNREDGGVDGGSCLRDEDCVHNEVCRANACAAPSGRCNPEGAGERDCYASARCDTTTTGAGALGYCTFTAPPRQVFPTESRITLESPNPDTPQDPRFGFTMRWQPLRGASGAVTVAAVLDAPPQLDVNTGRLTNWQSVKWIWSSAEPGGTASDPVMDGSVPLRFGHTSVSREGQLGAPATRDTLDTGRYFWLVYVIRQGEVIASSAVQWFVVGEPVLRPSSCVRDGDCRGPGELPETHSCVGGVCLARCASDFDCRGTGLVCALGVTFPGDVRRGAYCRAPTSPRDAGT